jgi:hypothetical protein
MFPTLDNLSKIMPFTTRPSEPGSSLTETCELFPVEKRDSRSHNGSGAMLDRIKSFVDQFGTHEGNVDLVDFKYASFKKEIEIKICVRCISTCMIADRGTRACAEL